VGRLVGRATDQTLVDTGEVPAHELDVALLVRSKSSDEPIPLTLLGLLSAVLLGASEEV
jgi:hypothetical protein